MKFRRIYYLLALLTGLILINSCKKEVTDKIPQQDKKLVVSGFISPSDDSVRVILSFSRPYYNQGSNDLDSRKQLSTSLVTISDGNVSVNLKWDNNKKYFSLPETEFPIIAGSEYILKILTTDGKEAEAKTIVPEMPQQTEFEVMGLKPSKNRVPGYKSQKCRFALADPVSSENFYRFTLVKRTVTNGIPGFAKLGDIFFTDKNRDGTVIKEFVEYDLSLELQQNTPTADTNFYHDAYFISGSKEYNLFHESLERNNLTEDNPFAEPNNIYSNVRGGYGIFAGFNQVVMTKEIK